MNKQSCTITDQEIIDAGSLDIVKSKLIEAGFPIKPFSGEIMEGYQVTWLDDPEGMCTKYTYIKI